MSRRAFWALLSTFLTISNIVKIRERPRASREGASMLLRREGGFLRERGPQMGGSDPSWLNLAFLGRPDFPSRGAKTL